MSIIRIPSSSIYGVGNNSFFNKNKLEQVALTANKFKLKTGNVLSDTYTLTYWSVDENTEGSITYAKFSYVGDNDEYNSFLSSLIVDNVTEKIAYVGLSKFSIGKDVVIAMRESELKGFSVIRTQKWISADLTTDGKLKKSYEYTKEIISNEDIVYNNDEIAFDYSLNDFKTDAAPYSGVRVLHFAVTIEGFYRYVYLVSETISIVGKYYESEESEHILGNSTVNAILLPLNELWQNGNTPSPIKCLQTIANNYQNGKEVHTIKCSVGEYYDIYGAKAIDPYDTNFPAIFEKHDIVEPYVFTSQGEVPLSEKADGTPKQFEIIGIDYTYRGVVWQELTLQEHIQ